MHEAKPVIVTTSGISPKISLLPMLSHVNTIANSVNDMSYQHLCYFTHRQHKNILLCTITFTLYLQNINALYDDLLVRV